MPMAHSKDSGRERSDKDPKGGTQDRETPPGTPFAGTTPAASRYTPGTETGGDVAGGTSAADLTGGGASGDIDVPDITGRGTTSDLLRANEAQRKADEAKAKASHTDPRT